MHDWENPTVVGVNRLPARAYFFPFADEGSALRGDLGETPLVASLNGQWKFYFSPTVAEVPEGFDQAKFDVSAWAELPVMFEPPLSPCSTRALCRTSPETMSPPP